MEGIKLLNRCQRQVCQYFYECKSCGEFLRPLLGDCCVFCSCDDRPCLPKQTH
ncbi:GDCCVxC domain-containing (seleno)protein [Tepidicaulis sp. LMO-SS28]|uniref:GDCCVxC domain-containing (seleno)protein n=1 Tax=Tepidicaulis sp. LMO-SS28 TaxID=3447455 RepID=UPI003EDF7948